MREWAKASVRTTGPIGQNRNQGPAPIGLWIIGMVTGALLISVAFVLLGFLGLVLKVDRDVREWMDFVKMIVWLIGSCIISFSALIPGLFGKRVPDPLRSGLIISGVLGLLLSLLFAGLQG